jgi:hypothetical protein
MRIEEATFFGPYPDEPDRHVVEIRSRPLWIVLLEVWFIWVHELTSHKLRLRIPYDDPYWGEPLEAGFHHFFTWTLNSHTTIDKRATYSNLKERE